MITYSQAAWNVTQTKISEKYLIASFFCTVFPLFSICLILDVLLLMQSPDECFD